MTDRHTMSAEEMLSAVDQVEAEHAIHNAAEAYELLLGLRDEVKRQREHTNGVEMATLRRLERAHDDAISAHSRAMWKQWVPLPELQLLEAKAAVSDAYLLVCEATDWEHQALDQSRRKDLSIAVKALRELESK